MSKRKHDIDDIIRRQNRLLNLLYKNMFAIHDGQGVRSKYWDMLCYLEYEIFQYMHDYLGEDERKEILGDGEIKQIYYLWDAKENKK